MSSPATTALILVRLVFSAIALLFLLRLLAELFRAASDNPVVAFIRRATQPLAGPLGRLLPTVGRISLAALALMLAAQAAKYLVTLPLQGLHPTLTGVTVLAVAGSLDLLLDLYVICILVWAINRSFAINTRHPLIGFIEAITDPVMIPLRSRVQSTRLGRIDLMPVAVILLILILRAMLATPLHELGTRLAQ